MKPFEFIRQVRGELSRVTWPSRQETLTTTWLVMAVSIVAAIFYIIVDHLVYSIIKAIFGLGQ